MKKVAFICVHNSCRSQIAEALGKRLASDVFESYSAGTETKPQINQDAVRIMKHLYGIDMERNQRSKLLSDIPPVDIVITMGCNVQCPYLPCEHREDWGLEDPSGKEDAAFHETIRIIEKKILELKERLEQEENIPKLMPVQLEDLVQYKLDMQEAFQMGAVEGGFPGDEEILPEDHIDRSLNTPGAIAYKAVMNGEMVGGAIVVLEGDHAHLDFLYVKHGIQSKGIGKFIWFEIEKRHPEIKLWETCTPYFEKRNIHFYVNVCGFHITEFFNAHHPDPNCPEDEYDGYFEGMFQFQKRIGG